MFSPFLPGWNDKNWWGWILHWAFGERQADGRGEGKNPHGVQAVSGGAASPHRAPWCPHWRYSALAACTTIPGDSCPQKRLEEAVQLLFKVWVLFLSEWQWNCAYVLLSPFYGLQWKQSEGSCVDQIYFATSKNSPLPWKQCGWSIWE